VGKRIPAFERQMALAEGLAVLRAMPGIDEPARRLLLHRAANGDFQIGHFCLKVPYVGRQAS
jgi:hypothetical protein